MKPKKMPLKQMAKLSPAAASRVRDKAKKMLGRDYVAPDKDSAAGAAT